MSNTKSCSNNIIGFRQMCLVYTHFTNNAFMAQKIIKKLAAYLLKWIKYYKVYLRNKVFPVFNVNNT